MNVFSEHALHNHLNASTLFGVENYDNDKLLFDFNKTEEEFDNKDDLFEQMQTDDIDISNTFVYHLILKNVHTFFLITMKFSILKFRYCEKA